VENMSQEQAEEILQHLRAREARRGQWVPAIAALVVAVVVVAVLILMAARQV
jgi:hypothetical protein